MAMIGFYSWSPYTHTGYELYIWLPIALLLAILFFLPSIIAFRREHKYKTEIFIINLFCVIPVLMPFAWIGILVYSINKELSFVNKNQGKYDKINFVGIVRMLLFIPFCFVSVEIYYSNLFGLYIILVNYINSINSWLGIGLIVLFGGLFMRIFTALFSFISTAYISYINPYKWVSVSIALVASIYIGISKAYGTFEFLSEFSFASVILWIFLLYAIVTSSTYIAGGAFSTYGTEEEIRKWINKHIYRIKSAN